MDIITMLNSTMPSGFWESIIGWFQSFIGNFGWTIILFTICLKIVLLPVDYWQKKTTRNNSQKQAILQPEIDKIKKKYAGNEQMINQKTMELYKANNYNVVGTCFGLLINLVVTMVVFFTLFGSLNNISYHKIKEEYATLETTYISAYNENYSTNFNTFLAEVTPEMATQWGLEFAGLSAEEQSEYASVDVYVAEKTEEYAENKVKELSQKEVSNKYGEIKESWLWIKNIFRPDTGASIFPKTADEYISLSSLNFNEKEMVVKDKSLVPAEVSTDNIVEVENYFDLDEDGIKEAKGYMFKYNYYSNIQEEYAFTAENAKAMFESDYNNVTGKLVEDYSGFNGYFILIILAGLVTVLSQILTNLGIKAKNKKGEEVKVKGNTNLILMVILPLFMVYFTIQYSSAFALYIVINSLFSAISGYLLNLLMNKLEERKKNKTKQPVVEYARKK